MGVHPGEGAPRPEAPPERTSLRSRLNARLRAAALGFPEPNGRPGEVPAGRINITWSWSGTRIPGPQRTFPSRSPAAPAPPDIDFATRKIARLLKPQKVIEQNGDSFTIHTNSSFRNYLVKFKVGEEFDEDNKGLDNRKCKSLVIWDNDRLTCVQKGQKKNRGWTHWIEGDQLHLEMFCEGQVCKQTFQRA
ncbi:retinoid-binding protein 7 isoform X1 [Orcinus orca]|uniref:retinoid-binding protein 7 isoform X1 n=1 Tax=Orcinus orca TaxID=9733 RepID=UPI0021128EF6|nr:retinoid-binding protein 7 isoform X1 [Orcinus orca]